MARCAKSASEKFAPRSRFILASTFMLNLAVTPRRSLYAASSVLVSLTMSSPTRKRSRGPIDSRTIPRKDADSPGDMLPRLRSEKDHQVGRPAHVPHQLQAALVGVDHSGDGQSGVVGRQGSRSALQRVGYVDRHVLPPRSRTPAGRL